jgi:hypothetical protein
VVLVNGWYILGEEVKAFENNFELLWNELLHLGNGLDALTSFFKSYIQLGRLQKGMKLLFLQTLILPVWLFLKLV